MRLIDADRAIDYIDRAIPAWSEDKEIAIDCLRNLPFVQPEPSEVARDIATIIENEKDMRVIAEPRKGKWIPITERLPGEDEDIVLMSVYDTEDDASYVDVGSTHDGIWVSATMGFEVWNGRKVTAWMPLPDPWEGEQDD